MYVFLLIFLICCAYQLGFLILQNRTEYYIKLRSSWSLHKDCRERKQIMKKEKYQYTRMWKCKLLNRLPFNFKYTY